MVKLYGSAVESKVSIKGGSDVNSNDLCYNVHLLVPKG